MKIPTFLIVLGLGWLNAQPVSAKVIDAQLGRTLWATGYVRSVHHVLVFDLGDESIRGNSWGSKVWLGADSNHPEIFRYLELIKHKGIPVRLHGYFAKVPATALTQVPNSPSIRFTIDKLHSTTDPDR
jgi:hypothetical protein